MSNPSKLIPQSLKIIYANQRSDWQRWLFFAVLSLILILAGTVAQRDSAANYRLPSAAQASLSLPALEGEKAIEHLKQEGLFDSLGEAMRAARYSINPVEQTGKRGLEPGSYSGANPAQRYQALFTSDRMQLVPQEQTGEWRVGMRLAGYGYGERLKAVTRAELKAISSRIEYHRRAVDDSGSTIVEWYENRAEGLEQGFTIDAPPMERQEGESLVVALELTGDLQASESRPGEALRLSKKDGAGVLSYEKLWAKDAKGRELAARMRLSGGKVLLEVDDTAAEYPVTIDPVFVQQQKLIASDGAVNDSFGWSVAISGETMVVGALSKTAPSGFGFFAGAAYVFVKTGTTWSQQQKLTASDARSDDGFGNSVAISGETIVIGAVGRETPAGESGAAYVFVRTGTVWSQQQILTGTGNFAGELFGNSVAISGETVVAGARRASIEGGNDAGAVYVFVRTGTVWSQQQKLTASDAFHSDELGTSVAISGETIVAGAPGVNTAGAVNIGSAYIFVRTGSVWNEQQKLVASDAAMNDAFGNSVDISGETVVIGARGEGHAGSDRAGAAYIFVRTGTIWSQQQKLTASDALAGDIFGFAVAISGETVVICAPFDPQKGGNGTFAYVFTRTVGVWVEQQKLIPNNPPGGFYSSVAISGGTVVIGSPSDDNAGGNDAGAAFVFACGGAGSWTEQAKNTASDGASGDFFGFSVAISGETVVVGSVLDNNIGGVDAGAAYVFVRTGTTWSQQQKLTASDGHGGKQFGVSVAINGERIVIGAHGDNAGGAGAGAAYVFIRVGTMWSQQQKLTASDGATLERFGFSVAISGETIVVGAHLDNNTGGFGAGAAYVFVRTGLLWSQKQKLTASDGDDFDEFGLSIAISGEIIVVGAHADDHVGGVGAGSAYVFLKTGSSWSQQQKLTASDGDDGDEFGFPVAINGETIVVSARLDDNVGGEAAGAVYVFVRTGSTWSEQQKLTASDGDDGDRFGWSVAITGETIVVGANADDHVDAFSAGSAYVFVRTGTLWSQQQKLTASDGAGGGFGWSVSISGETIVVGAAGNTNAGGTNAGASYVFAPSCTQTCTGITCPADITAVTAANCSSSTGTVVTFPTPTTGNCPGGTVACSPASGSMFPVGTTTVTCTATNGSGNTASCTFTVKVFNGCLQDDGNAGNVVLFNRTTGEYRFCCGGVVVATGVGRATVQGCTVTIEHNATDRKVLIKGDFSTNKGTALLQMPYGRTKCQITDRDMRNNSCQCGL